MNTTSTFENVVPALAGALEKRGFTALTPVQETVLAAGLGAADLLVSAQTGSGKTVAFGLAVAPTLLAGAARFGPAPVPLALIVAPTRELALQVKRELQWLYADTGASIASCVGGMDMREERRFLERGAHIVVGTPGRLRDHIERGSFVPTGLKAVILDEADEMLDLGFREDLEFILDASPTERRTLMFSATVPASITRLATRYQRDAVRLSTAAEQAQHVDIAYRALTVAPSDRENAVVNVLRYYEAKNALVFCGTRAAVNHMTSRFTNRGFAVVALSGELSQSERTHALQAMRDGRARVCIATDVAARGIDLPNLELVIHAEIPKTPETLLHRSGRTGRAGRKGVCALIVGYNERRRTERLLRDANIVADWAPPPSADDIVRRDRERTLADPVFDEPASDDERAFAATLLARHGAEKVAAAFLKLQAAGRSAPEELRDSGPPERKAKRRDDFTGGVWFSLSVGAHQKAEARWLLPMLCRFGKLEKGEVGAIRVQPDETHIELAQGSVSRFLAAIGPDRLVDGTIVVTRLDGAPAAAGQAAAAPAAPTRAPQAGKPAWAGKGKRPDRPARAGKRPQPEAAPNKPKHKKKHTNKFAKKSGGKPAARTDSRPAGERPAKPGRRQRSGASGG